MAAPARNHADGNGGLYPGMWPVKSQVEFLKPTIAASLVNALVSIGWWLALIGVLVALCVVIGPALIWIAGFAAILAAAARGIAAIQAQQPETERDEEFLNWMNVIVIVIALAVSAGWYFAQVPLYASWPSVTIWRVTFPMAGWAMAIAVAALAGVLIVAWFMFFHHLVEGFNPAAFNPIQAKPAHTPWWDPTSESIGPEDGEAEPDGDPPSDADTRAKLAEMLAEAMKNRPAVTHVALYQKNASRPNGNGNHKQTTTPGSGERIEQRPDYRYVVCEIGGSGKKIIHVQEQDRDISRPVALELFRRYAENAWDDRFGSGIRKWQEVYHVSPSAQATMRAALELKGFIEPANGAGRETITWRLSRDDAMSEFDRIFDVEPPAPITAAPIQSSPSPIVPGKNGDEQETGI